MKSYRFFLLASFLIGLILFVFLFHIDRPTGYLFDEGYYAESAKQIYERKPDPNYQHPPLGKALISIPLFLNIRAPYSWRSISLLFGFLGLGLVYYFARRISLTKEWSLVAVLILVGSRSWVTLSRLAMLDIFVAVFVLLSGLLLYLFLNVNGFQRKYERYSLAMLLLAGFFIGVGGAVKWNAFFILFFVLGLFLYYFKGFLWRRFVHFLLFLIVVFGTYFSIVYLFYGSVTQVLAVTGAQLLFHNSAMLPGNAYVGADTFHSEGGVAGFFNNLFLNPHYILKKEGFSPYSLSNNPVLFYSFVFFTLYLIYLLFLFIRRKEVSEIFIDRRLLYCYTFAMVMIVPWLLIPRIQYLYLYLPAFPFISLLVTLFLNRYCSVTLSRGYLFIYLLFFILDISTLISF